MSDYITDLNKSASFIDKILIILNLEFKILSMENHENPILKALDDYAGIDFIAVDRNKHCFGLAIRCQYIKDGKQPYNSFTIRYHRYTNTKTEYEKRIEAIENGYMFPLYTVQVYINEKTNEIISAAIIKTIDLYDFCKKYNYRLQSKQSDNEFLIAYWKDVELAEYNIKVVTQK